MIIGGRDVREPSRGFELAHQRRRQTDSFGHRDTQVGDPLNVVDDRHSIACHWDVDHGSARSRSLLRGSHDAVGIGEVYCLVTEVSDPLPGAGRLIVDLYLA